LKSNWTTSIGGGGMATVDFDWEHLATCNWRHCGSSLCRLVSQVISG